MTPASPLDIAFQECLSAEQSERVHEAASRVPDPPQSIDLLDIVRPDGADPDELLKNRFLCKGGGLLMCGQTGAGKSSFNMQALVSWALGRPCFGIEPTRPLTSLLVQAENDSVDLAEFRDGIFKGLELDDAEFQSLRGRIQVARENARTAAEFFTQTLRPLVEKFRPDLLWIDPALAYLGGESNSQKDVGSFLRNLLNPLLTEFKCAAVVVHHGNKPPSGQQKPQWQAGDFAYLGGGSAEWANWARAVIVIRSIGSETIYELRAAKRGRRLRWQDAEGEYTCRKHIAWSKDPNSIYWREPDPDELEDMVTASKVGRPSKLSPVEVVHCIRANEGQNQSYYKRALEAACGCGSSVVQRAITATVDDGLVRYTDTGFQKLYHLTEKGREMAEKVQSVVKWTDPEPKTPE